MRIISSDINGKVDHHSKQNTGDLKVIKSRQSQTELDENQRIIGSKETINLSYSQKYESEQSSRLYSHSQVTDTQNNTQQELTQEEITHSLVSGIMQHNVHISDVIFTHAFPIPERSNLLSGSEQGGTQNTIFEEFGLTDELSEEDASSLSIRSDSIDGRVNASELSVTQQYFYQEEESLTLISEGKISTTDGRAINFRLELDLDSQYKEVTEQNLNVRSEEFVDPLVISLNGQAPSLTNSTFMFDIDSDGINDKLSQLAPGAGFLAFDQNQDGVINNGSELFGPHSGNGYSDLSVYDANSDGWIDESDAIFDQLQVWQPTISQPNKGSEDGSLQSLKDSGIGAISLQSLESPFTLKDEQNNILGKVQRSGIYVKENGEVGLVQQIDLAVRNEAKSENTITAMFNEQATKLEQQFREYVSDNQAQVFEFAEIEFAALNLNMGRFNIEALRQDLNRDIEEFEFDRENLPMMIIAKHFEIESEIQQRSNQQYASYRSTSFKQINPASNQAEKADAPNPSHQREFKIFSHHDQANISEMIRGDDTHRSAKSKIIEEVLRPLNEQLKHKREQASDAYLKR